MNGNSLTEDRKALDILSRSLTDFRPENMNMGIDGPIVGVGQRNNKMIHSIDGLQNMMNEERQEVLDEIQKREEKKEIRYQIRVTNAGKLEEFQQQFKITDQTLQLGYEEDIT